MEYLNHFLIALVVVSIVMLLVVVLVGKEPENKSRIHDDWDYDDDWDSDYDDD